MSQPLWKIEHVSLRGDHRPRLDDVSVEIPEGATAVVGYSGAGKTSLLNLLIEFERPDEGSITSNLPNADNRLPLYWVPQTEGLWPHLTVAEHLRFVAATDKDKDGKDSEKQSHALLNDFDLTDRAPARPGELSQGERARLAVARALAGNAAILVMDEPLVHVDPARLGTYWQKIRDHCAERGTSIIFATHSSETVLREADNAICLHEGRIMYAGKVEDLYYRPEDPQLAEFLGPSNWLKAHEATDWFGESQEADCCYRPEQIVIGRSDESPLVVQASSFSGSIAEVELLDERTRRKRTFFHRPSRAKLHVGDRVVLKLLLALLMCWLTVGCGNDTDPKLDVQEIRYWPMPPDGPRIPAPRAMTVGPHDDVYVLDDAGRVLVLDSDGKVLKKWRMPESEIGNPEGISIFKDGRIVVADTHYHRVVFFDETGKVLEMLGEFGKEPSQFIYPVAIVQDDSENFYVCEYGENDRVQKFSVDGKFLLEFGSFGTAPGQFQRPSGIFWYDGKIFAVDAFNNRIQVFSDSGTFLHILGESGQTPSLHYPYDITGNSKGELYVVEYGAGRVTKLDMHGKLLGRFGKTGRGDGQLLTPWGLTIDSKSRLLVADTGNRRIVELKL